MKWFLPGWNELAIFLGLAVLCAAVACCAPALDLGLAMLSMPIFIAACLMGMHRTGKLSPRQVPVEADEE